MVTEAPAHPAASTTTDQGDYLVRLSSFHGPLDLLLYLIRRAEMDIHDVPIAAITEQYLAFVQRHLRLIAAEPAGRRARRSIEPSADRSSDRSGDGLDAAPEGRVDAADAEHADHLDMEEAGEFLVMAATLVQIKARTLAPARRGGDDGEPSVSESERSDPRAELITALLAYQRYRNAAEALEARRLAFARSHAIRIDAGEPADAAATEASGSIDDESAMLELEDCHLLDLSETYARIASGIDFARLGDHRVVDEDTPIALLQEDLLDRLGRAEGGLSLRSVFEGRSRLEMVGLFLAALELARQGKLAIEDAGDEVRVAAIVEEA